jgi:bacterioferritin (cytochrome b1)
VKGNPEVIAGFQSSATLFWSLATLCHLASKVLKHKDLKSPAGHVQDLGECAEGWAQHCVKQILFLGGKPTLGGATATDDFTTYSGLFEKVLEPVEALWAKLNADYVKFIQLEDADSAHDCKDVIHQLEKHYKWLERQIDVISFVGEVNYVTAKIV